MEGESGVGRSFIDELHSWDIQGDQMVGESGVTRSIIDEVLSSYIQRDQIEGERGVTGSIIDSLHSSDRFTSFFGYPSRSNGRWKWCYSKYY